MQWKNEWIKKFPNIKAVADASEESILKSWEGLGYYSRCRNFHRAAKIIVKEYNSIIPDTWDEFRSLPGVGDYTAGAVLSIAFNKNYVAIDGNVKRVMARLTGRKKLSKYNQNYFKSSLNKHIDKNTTHKSNTKTNFCISCSLTLFTYYYGFYLNWGLTIF